MNKKNTVLSLSLGQKNSSTKIELQYNMFRRLNSTKLTYMAFVHAQRKKKKKKKLKREGEKQRERHTGNAFQKLD